MTIWQDRAHRYSYAQGTIVVVPCPPPGTGWDVVVSIEPCPEAVQLVGAVESADSRASIYVAQAGGWEYISNYPTWGAAAAVARKIDSRWEACADRTEPPSKISTAFGKISREQPARQSTRWSSGIFDGATFPPSPAGGGLWGDVGAGGNVLLANGSAAGDVTVVIDGLHTRDLGPPPRRTEPEREARELELQRQELEYQRRRDQERLEQARREIEEQKARLNREIEAQRIRAQEAESAREREQRERDRQMREELAARQARKPSVEPPTDPKKPKRVFDFSDEED